MSRGGSVGVLASFFALLGCDCAQCDTPPACEAIGTADQVSDDEVYGLSDAVAAYTAAGGEWSGTATCGAETRDVVVTITPAAPAGIDVWSEGDPDHSVGSCDKIGTALTGVAIEGITDVPVTLWMDTILGLPGDSISAFMSGSADGYDWTLRVGIDGAVAASVTGPIACSLGALSRS